MKRLFFILLSVIFFLSIVGCPDGSSRDPETPTTVDNAGIKITYSADGVTITMVYIPGGLTFPTGVNDEGSASVSNGYWIATTEVTYELWNKVHTWATSGSGTTGAGQYTFANSGTMGDGYGDTIQHPVTFVNWRDSMVWSNALTEWYNAQKGTSLECVYTYSSEIIRNSQDSNCDNAVVDPSAKGFRLQTSNEFELAARYRDGILWTYGDHASGDNSGACSDDGSILGGLGISTVFGNYAVYNGNCSSLAPVESKISNALGIYDMSGNVYEWCYDLNGTNRVVRGGSWWYDAYNIQVGHCEDKVSTVRGSNIGIRLAMTY
ncbi:MAG: SUMF1/EgtB/PvdO family nonheme iron enzyme [Spirochaetales bacterium]|nr:SUMF1/EgtB/PvdO family nonheme iron enzyme [Spirochaetales bacterium]